MALYPVIPILRRARWYAVALLSLCAAGLRAEDVSKEYQLKAAFLYNFTKFIEWPPERFAEETSPIVIGVLGENPFGEELQKIVEGRTVRGHPIHVKVIQTVDEAATVHLLFIPNGAETRFAARTVWRDAGVVTVGETARFSALGGAITFVRDDDKLRFVINLKSAESGGLKISAQLLKLASEVRGKS